MATLSRFTLLILLSLSCTPTPQRHFESVSRVCGDETLVRRENEPVLQVKQPNGEALDTLMLDQLSVRFRPDQGPPQPVSVTRKACVLVPPGQGQVEVQLGKQRWAAVKRYDKTSSTARFESLALMPVADFHLQLACPADGYFANQNLPVPFGIQTHGDENLLAFELRATRVSDEGHTRLWYKPMGVPSTALPTTIDTRGLAQGVYRLELIGKDLSRNWEDSSVAYQESCSLIVLKTPLTISGLPLTPSLKIPVYEPDALIPFESNVTHSQLFTCREPLTQFDPVNPCPASTACADDAQFSAVNILRIKEPGLWRVHAYFQDQAGNRSATACQTLAISAKAPTLSVLWEKDELNRPDAVLPLPEPFLVADMQVQHPQLAAENLEPSLQCKLDFLVGGVAVRAGKDALCASGRCAGQDLDSFRSCDRHLKIALASALQEPAVHDAQLRLTVRSQDGAGHSSEQVRTLWLQKNRWGYTALATPQQKPTELSVNAQGEVVVQEAGKTLLWREQQWKDLTPPITGPIGNVHIFSMDQRRIGAIWDGKPVELIDQTWKPLELTGWNPEVDRCEQIFAAYADAVICSHGKELILLEARTVKARQPVDDRVTCIKTGEADRIVRYGKNSWAVACKAGELWVTTDDKGWQQIDRADVLGRLKPSALQADALGRLWFVKGFSVGYPFRMMMWDQKEVQIVETPDSIEPNFPALTLALDARGQLLFQRYIRDEGKKAWVERPQLRELFPSGVVRTLNTPDGGVFYESVEQIVYQNPRTEDLRLMPWKGLNAAPRTSTLSLADGPDGRLCVLAAATPAVHCLQPRPWGFWGRMFLNLPNEKIMSILPDSKGVLTAQVEGRGTFQLKQGGWQPVLPEANFNVISVFPAQDNFYLGSPEGVWRYDSGSFRWTLDYSFTKDGSEYAAWLANDQAFARDSQGREWLVQSSGGFLTRQAGRWKKQFWFDPDVLVEKIAVVNGALVAMSGLPPYSWPRVTTFDEASQEFTVRYLSDWSIDPENVSAYDLSRDGVLVLQELSGQLAVIDLRTGDLRRSSSPPMSQDFKVFEHQGHLILVTDSSIYEETQNGEWSLVVDRSSVKPQVVWKPQDTFLDGSGHLWIPVTMAPSSWTHDLLRVDLTQTGHSPWTGGPHPAGL